MLNLTIIQLCLEGLPYSSQTGSNYMQHSVQDILNRRNYEILHTCYDLEHSPVTLNSQSSQPRDKQEQDFSLGEITALNLFSTPSSDSFTTSITYAPFRRFAASGDEVNNPYHYAEKGHN